MRPNVGGASCATQKATAHKDRPQNQKEFAADTATASGESKAQVNRHLARAEALGDDLDEVAGTSLDKGVELAHHIHVGAHSPAGIGVPSTGAKAPTR